MSDDNQRSREQNYYQAKGRQTSRASEFFADRPQLFEQLKRSPSFETWLESFPRVLVDQEVYYVVGGDILRDIFEMLLNWAVESGQINPDDVR